MVVGGDQIHQCNHRDKIKVESSLYFVCFGPGLEDHGWCDYEERCLSLDGTSLFRLSVISCVPRDLIKTLQKESTGWRSVQHVATLFWSSGCLVTHKADQRYFKVYGASWIVGWTREWLDALVAMNGWTPEL